MIRSTTLFKTCCKCSDVSFFETVLTKQLVIFYLKFKLFCINFCIKKSNKWLYIYEKNIIAYCDFSLKIKVIVRPWNKKKIIATFYLRILTFFPSEKFELLKKSQNCEI